MEQPKEHRDRATACEPPFWRDPRILFHEFHMSYRPTCHHSPWNFIARIVILSLFVGLIGSYFAGLSSLAVALLFGSLTAFAIVYTTPIAIKPSHNKPVKDHARPIPGTSGTSPSGTPVQDYHGLPYTQHAEEGFTAQVNGGAAEGAVQPWEQIDAHPYAGPSLPDYTPPTSRNLFMNILLDEQKYNPTRPAAAPVDHPLVKQTMDDFFRVQWFSDPTDVFGKNQSQRQFITMPSTTVPNDQGSFADWLYRIPGKTCKEGGRDACVAGTNGHIPWLGH